MEASTAEPDGQGSGRGAAQRAKAARTANWHDAAIAATALLIPGLTGLILFAIPATREGIGAAVLTASASFAVGAFFGFIFGIPRTLSSPLPAGTTIDGGYQVMPNTNLEQISDWLTKILVGVGLVELGKIGDTLSNVAQGLSPSLGGGSTGYPAAMALIISFLILGFIGSYLFTRLRLPGAFSAEAMLGEVKEQVEKVEQVKKGIDESAAADSRAQVLVENQLHIRKRPPDKIELVEALRASSATARVNAFYLAREQRRANWRDGDKHLVERTIPVFEALIACDDENRFHRNHGELGYALKDQDVPDYARALAEFEEAIKIRPPGQATRYWPYEFNRALCKCKLDPDFCAGKPSAEALVAEVCDDLEVPLRTQTGAEAVRDDRVMMKWIELNSANPRVAELKQKLAP